MLTWALTITTVAEQPEPVGEVEPRPAPAPLDYLPVPDLETGEEHQVPLFWRPDLKPGATFEGPAIIVEDETSTFVTRRFRGSRRGQPLSRHRTSLRRRPIRDADLQPSPATGWADREGRAGCNSTPAASRRFSSQPRRRR